MRKYGYSTPQGKQEIKNFLLSTLHKGDKILDVGPGEGTYYNLLGKDYDWSAVEIWHDTAVYAAKFYNKVYEGSIVDFYYPEEYDLVIFGDVIEHLEIEDAKLCIERAKKNAKAIMIAIPYDTKQGILYGNEAEIHHQTEMSSEIFDERYPGFKRVVYISLLKYAYYYWSKED